MARIPLTEVIVMMVFTVPVGTINFWTQMVQIPCTIKPEMIHSMAAMTTTHCMVTISMTRCMAALEIKHFKDLLETTTYRVVPGLMHCKVAWTIPRRLAPKTLTKLIF
jgi:hypothetical protein